MLTTKQLLAVVADRIRRDKLACAAYTDPRARRIACVTLDDLAMNIVLELDKNIDADTADSFLKACGPTHKEKIA
jgi:hypothetical protein